MTSFLISVHLGGLPVFLAARHMGIREGNSTRLSGVRGKKYSYIVI